MPVPAVAAKEGRIAKARVDDADKRTITAAE
jgi:hypothetical protein